MNQHSFLVIHGLGGSGSGHWQTWLYQELTKRKINVCYPTFSNLDAPNINVWLQELTVALETIPENHTLSIVTHSLGCLLWLHYAETLNRQVADRAILVAPPSPNIILPQAKSFYFPPLNSCKLHNASKETLFVHSSNDPYCSMEDAALYSKLGTKTITFPNMGHINTDSGHGKWPWIFELCMKKELVSI